VEEMIHHAISAAFVQSALLRFRDCRRKAGYRPKAWHGGQLFFSFLNEGFQRLTFFQTQTFLCFQILFGQVAFLHLGLGFTRIFMGFGQGG